MGVSRLTNNFSNACRQDYSRHFSAHCLRLCLWRKSKLVRLTFTSFAGNVYRAGEVHVPVIHPKAGLIFSERAEHRNRPLPVRIETNTHPDNLS